MTVNILGTVYMIRKMGYADEPEFQRRKIDGYCDRYQHLIVYCDLDSDKRWDGEPEITKRECEKATLRHEIVHAFMFECGLGESTHGTEHGWAVDEEIVDWISEQTPKIFRTFKEAGAV